MEGEEEEVPVKAECNEDTVAPTPVTPVVAVQRGRLSLPPPQVHQAGLVGRTRDTGRSTSTTAISTTPLPFTAGAPCTEALAVSAAGWLASPKVERRWPSPRPTTTTCTKAHRCSTRRRRRHHPQQQLTTTTLS